MRLSVNVPNFGDLPERIGLGTMAREAEAAGADGVWLADHLLLVDEVMTGYPYAPDGIYPQPATLPFYDSLASCAFLAAATERCRIGIGVLVLPQRNVLEVAKVAATIDRLSGGRFAEGDLYVLINAFWEPVPFRIQEGTPRDWHRIVDTSRPSPEDVIDPAAESPLDSLRYVVEPRSVVVLGTKV